MSAPPGLNQTASPLSSVRREVLCRQSKETYDTTAHVSATVATETDRVQQEIVELRKAICRTQDDLKLVEKGHSALQQLNTIMAQACTAADTCGAALRRKRDVERQIEEAKVTLAALQSEIAILSEQKKQEDQQFEWLFVPQDIDDDDSDEVEEHTEMEDVDVDVVLEKLVAARRADQRAAASAKERQKLEVRMAAERAEMQQQKLERRRLELIEIERKTMLSQKTGLAASRLLQYYTNLDLIANYKLEIANMTSELARRPANDKEMNLYRRSLERQVGALSEELGNLQNDCFYAADSRATVEHCAALDEAIKNVNEDQIPKAHVALQQAREDAHAAKVGCERFTNVEAPRHKAFLARLADERNLLQERVQYEAMELKKLQSLRKQIEKYKQRLAKYSDEGVVSESSDEEEVLAKMKRSVSPCSSDAEEIDDAFEFVEVEVVEQSPSGNLQKRKIKRRVRAAVAMEPVEDANSATMSSQRSHHETGDRVEAAWKEFLLQKQQRTVQPRNSREKESTSPRRNSSSDRHFHFFAISMVQSVLGLFNLSAARAPPSAAFSMATAV